MEVTARSVIFDIDNNYGNIYELGIRAIEFFNSGTLVLNPAPNSYATTFLNANWQPAYAFDTDLSKGSWGVYNSWLSTQPTNQRLIVVFGAMTTFDEIRIDNFHDNSFNTSPGAKDVKIYAADDVITDTSYGTAIPGSVLIFDGSFREHIADPGQDTETLTLGESGVEQEFSDPIVTLAGLYTLTLTGTPPVLLPCANFLARLRSGRRSYLQATIPYTSEVADIISTRPDDDLELKFYDSAGDPHVVLTVALDGIQIARGVQTASIVLTGWRQSTNGAPSTHSDIRAMTVSSGTNSATMTMPGYRPEIQPADTVETEGVGFVAGLVTVQASARRNDIEVRTTMSEEASV